MARPLDAVVRDVVLADVDASRSQAVAQRVVAQTSHFLARAHGCEDLAQVGDIPPAQLHAELRTLDRLNFRLKHPGAAATGFEDAMRESCAQLLLERLGVRAADVANFLVDNCDIDFLEDCEDAVVDGDDDDDDDTGALLMQLADLADQILRFEHDDNQPQPDGAGDDAGAGAALARDGQVVPAAVGEGGQAAAAARTQAWDESDINGTAALLDGRAATLRQLVEQYRTTKAPTRRAQIPALVLAEEHVRLTTEHLLKLGAGAGSSEGNQRDVIHRSREALDEFAQLWM